MYDIVLFDLDGTLTDPGLGITNSVAHALAKWNIQVGDRSELYKYIGPPLLDSFAEYCGFSPEECQLAVKYFREYFTDKGIYENEIYPGIRELLEKLKTSGRKAVVATSKPEEFALIILRYFSIDGYFDAVAGASMDESRSKKAEIIEDALKKCGAGDRSKVVMVGDRKHDILGAKQAGVDSIGVLFGYGSREELEEAGATYIAGTVEDIYKFL